MQKVTQAYFSFMTQYAGISALWYAICEFDLIGDNWRGAVPHAARLMYAPDGMPLHMSTLQEFVPVMCFMHLESILEDFLLQTLETLYFVNPQAVSKQRDGALEYDEILSAKSIEELMERIVYETVRATPRSLNRMISDIKKFDVSLDGTDLAQPFFVEMGATRNVWAHNGGRVDRDYLVATRDYWRMVDRKPPAEGATRVITPNYALEAMERARTLVHQIEEHMEEQHPGTLVRDIQDLENGLGDRHRHFSGLSKELEQALRANGFEVSQATVAASSDVGFSFHGPKNVVTYFSVEIRSEELADRHAIANMLAQVTQEMLRFAAEQQLPYELEYLCVRLHGPETCEDDMHLTAWSGWFTQKEFADAQLQGLEGADFLKALGIEPEYLIPF